MKMSIKNDKVFCGNLILVNSNYPCHKCSGSCSLVPVNDKNPDTLLDQQSARLLDRFLGELDAREQIVPVSGWRSQSEQTKIYKDSLAENGEEFTQKYVALPGFSEHQTGLAIDLAENKRNIDFICPDFPYEGICQSFREKAPLFGFTERYPKGRESITGIAWEPWHFRYVGFPHSAIMQQLEMTLEEYHDFLKPYKYGINHFLYHVNSKKFEISYLEAAKGVETSFEVVDGAVCMVSGNNIDGFIITIWG